MPISDFFDLMPDEITHAPMTGRDKYGKPTFGSGTDFKARVLFKPTWVRGVDGTLVRARGMVWIGGTPNVDPQDQITLPDSTTPPIMAVERIPDEVGIHHVKVFFG